ncbi:pyridoxamine 5'-phosphate oxidase family protein [Nocardia thraciensis]
MAIEFRNRGQARRTVVSLGSAEALRLVAGVSFGRVLFTSEALPAVCLASHLLDSDGMVVVRVGLIVPPIDIVRDGERAVVAYEVDEFDPVRHVGWSVVVTGFARVVTDIEQVTPYQLQLEPWADDATDTIIAIEPVTVKGIRLVRNSI